MIPFTMIVDNIAKMASPGSGFASLGEPGMSFSTDSFRICRNEMTMMTEKTRIPIGSRRRRPMGNRLLSEDIFHDTSLFVAKMIIVQSRSKALSTSDAMRERDEE